jgi:exodeoxyribonuclease-3
MKLKIISWNVNSVRKRKEQIEELIRIEDPDVVLLQETKVEDTFFPEFNTMFVSKNGQKGRNGVATLTKKPCKIIGKSIEEARMLAISYENFNIINVYVPNGFSVSASVVHKLDFFDRLKTFTSKISENLIMGGDFNIAYRKEDFTCPNPYGEDEIAYFKEFEKLYKSTIDSTSLISWWDYRANSFKRNIGIGLDKFYVSENLNTTKTRVLKKYRGNSESSDHAPVFIEIM